MRGGPADIVASGELQRASVALRCLYLELRPHREGREWAIITTVGAALSAAAFGVRMRITEAEAEALAEEGLALGLFGRVTRPCEDGEGVEERLEVVPLPRSVYRARYADRRGPRGGRSDAERKRDERMRRAGKSAPSPAERDDAGEGASVKRIADVIDHETAAPPAAVSNRDASRTETAPVTGASRDGSQQKPVTAPEGGVSLSPPPGDPPKGVPGEGRGDTPERPTSTMRRSWEETGRWALGKLGERTGRALDATAIKEQWRHLGRVVMDREMGADELELTAAWLREAPEAWRKVLPRHRGLLLTVEALLGDKLDNRHTGSGLAACLVAAREWERRRAGPGPVTVTGDASRGKLRATGTDGRSCLDCAREPSGRCGLHGA